MLKIGTTLNHHLLKKTDTASAYRNYRVRVQGKIDICMIYDPWTLMDCITGSLQRLYELYLTCFAFKPVLNVNQPFFQLLQNVLKRYKGQVKVQTGIVKVPTDYLKRAMIHSDWLTSLSPKGSVDRGKKFLTSWSSDGSTLALRSHIAVVFQMVQNKRSPVSIEATYLQTFY